MTLEYLGSTLGLATTDLKLVVVSIIQLVLGLLGFIQVLVVLYAGFVLMISSDDDARHTAKVTLGRSVLGVLIIGAAWAIVTFLFNSVATVTS